MARVPRHKIARRFGFDVHGTGGAALARRLGVPPGGRRRRPRRPSQYALELTEKQKLKAIYGLEERALRRAVEAAAGEQEPFGPSLLRRLERRLDNVVYRLGFARTRPMARQLVVHGHVRVNGRRVDVPSALVEPGDTVALRPEAERIPAVAEELAAARPVPPWLSRGDGASGRVERLPEPDEVDLPVDLALVRSFYAR